MKTKLLFLEDDINLNETITEYLEDEGFDVLSVYEGERAEDILYETKFDLLILDVNVPSPNGFELLERARENNVQTPAIFTTSRNSIDDVEEGFESGADDYLKKPYSPKELLLRIQNLLKRNFSHHNSNQIKIEEDIFFDIDTKTLLIKDIKQKLGDKESRLLNLFLQHKNELLTHEVIISHLWDYEESSSDDSLRTYIKHLRKLLGKDHIVSHKRLGYQFL